MHPYAAPAIVLGFWLFSALAAETVTIGDEAPRFVLQDASGRSYDLERFRGKNAVVLEFFRSGDW